VDLSPEHTSSLHANTHATMRSHFIEKFNGLRREVANSGIKRVLPAMTIAVCYADAPKVADGASHLVSGAPDFGASGFVIDPESVECMDSSSVLILLVRAARETMENISLSLSHTSLDSTRLVASSLISIQSSPVLSCCDVIFKFRKTVCCSTQRSTEAAASGTAAVGTGTCALTVVSEGPPCARLKVFANMAKSIVHIANLMIQ
jgi:hypothetical protein